MKLNTKTIVKGYAYAWLTLGFFLGSLVLHWWFGWKAFVAAINRIAGLENA